jgi:hypothetical protein
LKKEQASLVDFAQRRKGGLVLDVLYQGGQWTGQVEHWGDKLTRRALTRMSHDIVDFGFFGG